MRSLENKKLKTHTCILQYTCEPLQFMQSAVKHSNKFSYLMIMIINKNKIDMNKKLRESKYFKITKLILA